MMCVRVHWEANRTCCRGCGMFGMGGKCVMVMGYYVTQPLVAAPFPFPSLVSRLLWHTRTGGWRAGQ